MYLLSACTISWLCLLGAFITTWVSLSTPRSTTDLVVIIAVGTVTVLFSRLGLVSLLTLLIRLLPNGRMRSLVARSILRIVPTVLTSSVLAAASASLAVHAAQASPSPADDLTPRDHWATAIAATALPADAASADTENSTSDPALDPGWPTAVPDNGLPPDPGWPSAPPWDAPETSPDHDPLPKGDDSSADDADETATAANERADEDADVHVVGIGDSLWSIAADRPSSSATTQDIIDEIYTANREVIGANPNLIMPGQRLEIQP